MLKYVAEKETVNWQIIIAALQKQEPPVYSDLDPLSKNDRNKVSSRYVTLVSAKEHPKNRMNKEAQEVVSNNWEAMKPFIAEIKRREEKFSSEAPLKLGEVHLKRKAEEALIKQKAARERRKATKVLEII